MTHVILAAFGAFAFGLNNVVSRRAVIRIVDATTGVLITVPLSVLFFLLILLITGGVSSITSFSWQSYGWLAAAGVFHFVIGRSLNYNLIQLVGANIATILRRVNPIVSVILAITILGETLNWQLVAGVLLIITGLVITAWKPGKNSSGGGFSGIPGRAYLLGLAVGLSWGVSPIFVKLGLGSSGSPVAGAFISYLAATVVLSNFLWNGGKRGSLSEIKGKTLGFFCLTGLLSSISQLMRYVALSLGPASVVAPIFATSPVFVLMFSFVFNRKLEAFGPNVIIGITAVVIGGLLLI